MSTNTAPAKVVRHTMKPQKNNLKHKNGLFEKPTCSTKIITKKGTIIVYLVWMDYFLLFGKDNKSIPKEELVEGGLKSKKDWWCLWGEKMKENGRKIFKLRGEEFKFYSTFAEEQQEKAQADKAARVGKITPKLVLASEQKPTPMPTPELVSPEKIPVLNHFPKENLRREYPKNIHVLGNTRQERKVGRKNLFKVTGCGGF